MANCTWRRLRAALLGPLVWACVSCGASDSTEPSAVRAIDYELFPSTHQLSPSSAALISDVAEDGTLRFTQLP